MVQLSEVHITRAPSGGIVLKPNASDAYELRTTGTPALPVSSAPLTARLFETVGMHSMKKRLRFSLPRAIMPQHAGMGSNVWGTIVYIGSSKIEVRNAGSDSAS